MKGNRVGFIPRHSAYDASRDEGEGRKHRPDFILAITSITLLVIGLIVMYSISPAVAAVNNQAANYYFTRHILALGIGIVGVALIYNMPLGNLKKLVYPLLALSVIASGVILAMDGVAYRWIKIAGFSFQPAELVKFGLILWLGFFLSKQRKSGLQKNIHLTLKPVLIVLGAIAFVIVILQRDLGSMVVIAAITGLMLFVASVPLRPLILVFLGLVLLGAIAIASTPYRRDRFETFLNPARDCQNEGYHACQALIAVGSGGLMGLGVGNSVQAYGYLPETTTDSIFAIYAEKFGFIGSVILITLLGIIIMRLFRIAARTSTWESRLITTGIVTWIAVQASINIGAMVGLLPLKGITLPLVSYGGSSLIFVMLALGVALRISCYTSVRKQDIESKKQNNENTSERWGNRRSYHAPLSSR